MKESAWRSKLVRLYKQQNPDDFIRVMESRFIAGFPDLLRIKNGNAQFFELKVCKGRQIKPPEKLLSKNQESTLRKLRNAGCNVYVLIRNELTNNEVAIGIWIIGPGVSMEGRMLDENKFNQWWIDQKTFERCYAPYGPRSSAFMQ